MAPSSFCALGMVDDKQTSKDEVEIEALLNDDHYADVAFDE